MCGITSQQRIPLMDVIRCLDFSDEDLSWGHEQNIEAVSKEKKGTDGIGLDTNETKTEPAYNDSMLKGMTGYQLTAADLDFINKMKEEKLLKQLQEEMEEVQRLLKREEMALELACASRDKVQAELNKFPSCKELSEWIKVVLKLTSPSMDLTDLDVKALLGLVTEEDVQRTMDETSLQIKRTERILANRRKKEADERGQLEKVIATKQLETQRMMTQLSDVTSELARQEEVYKALQMQIEASKKAKGEAKVEDVTEDASEVKQQRKQRKKTKEKLQEAKNQRKPSRSVKHVDGKTENKSGKDDTNETPSTLTRTVQPKLRSVKAAKGPQRKVHEQEVKSQESVQTTRGRQKSAGATKTLAAPAEQKNPTKVKHVDVQSCKSLQAAPSCSRGKVAVGPRGDEEEAQSTGLRRSKRIASKR